MQNGLIITGIGNKFWYKDDLFHREDGPAFEGLTGEKEWYKNGSLHRIGGPALESRDGIKEWWVNGKKSRLEGPAVIKINDYEYWFLNGIEYQPEEHPFNIFRSEYNLSDNYNNWPKEMQVLFKLIYG